VQGPGALLQKIGEPRAIGDIRRIKEIVEPGDETEVIANRFHNRATISPCVAEEDFHFLRVRIEQDAQIVHHAIQQDRLLLGFGNLGQPDGLVLVESGREVLHVGYRDRDDEVGSPSRAREAANV